MDYESELESLLNLKNSYILKKISNYPDKVLECYVPHESHIIIPDKIPHFKEYRFLFGGCDSPFYDKFKNIGNVTFFPTYWLFPLISNIKFPKNTKFSFNTFGLVMNYQTKKHRRLMMQKLLKNDLLHHFEWSWKSIKEKNVIFELENKNKRLLSGEMNINNHSIEEWKIPNEYYTTFFELVQETHIDIPFITEKTFKPLLIGKPFISNACKGFHTKYLKDLGFELYDEIIDYSFDNLPLEKRMDYIIKEISNLVKQDWNLLYAKIQDKLKYNQQRVIEIVESKIGVPDLKTKLECYQYFNNITDVPLEKVKKKI